MVLSKMRSVNTCYGLQDLKTIAYNMYYISQSYLGSREFCDCGRYCNIVQRPHRELQELLREEFWHLMSIGFI